MHKFELFARNSAVAVRYCGVVCRASGMARAEGLGRRRGLKQSTIALGRILRIPLGLDYSWFLMFVLLTWMLAASYYPAEFPNWPAAQYWLLGAVTAILLFGSVVLHELGHSVMARRYHIPVRRITLFVFGGVAELGAEPPSATADFWIAIAGPVVSFALAVLFGLLQPLVAAVTPLLALAKYLALINGSLALFNLIPGFPLDGGRIFRAIVWGATHDLRWATRIAATLGRVIAYGFIIVGVVQVLNGNFGGLWIAFIGWFLESAAIAQLQQQRVQDLLAGHRVAEAMSRGYTAITPDVMVQQVVDQYILGRGQRCFVVEREGTIIGLLTLHHIKELPRAAWPATTVAQAMLPIDQVHRVQPDVELWTALEEMDRDGVNQLPVLAGNQMIGMLSRDNIIGFLRMMQEVGA
jgi:Zn-dependent protease